MSDFFCKSCGSLFTKWSSRCSQCGALNKITALNKNSAENSKKILASSKLAEEIS